MSDIGWSAELAVIAHAIRAVTDKMAGIKEHAQELHSPGLIETESHVYEFWYDGEVTLTKAGDLYRQRSLHQIAPPVMPTPRDREDNWSVVVTAQQAKELRAEMIDIWTQVCLAYQNMIARD